MEKGMRDGQMDQHQLHASCFDCGMAYGGPGWIEAVVPNAVWKLIAPVDGDGILCIGCMGRRLARLGMDCVPVKLTAGPLVMYSGGGRDAGATLGTEN